LSPRFYDAAVSGDAAGRGSELGNVVGVLDAVRHGADGHIVEVTGEAGIGKSTLVAAVLAAARAAGWRVWAASPTAAEATFPWTGLAQLLADVRRSDLDALVDSHVAQLEGATSPSRTAPVEPELVAFGLAALLDTARDDAVPVLLAIDDFHWLDPATAGALAYALRGTPGRRCVVLLASRPTERRPFEPVRITDSGHHTAIDVPGLSIASLREIIADTTGHSLGRADLAQIHQRTGGNPLYSVELARAVLDGLTLDVALPPSLRDTIGNRIAALPDDTRRVLGAAALTVTPTLGRLAATLGADVVAALAPAETAQLVRVRHRVGADADLEFRHPLMAAASIDALTTAERLAIHADLAASTDDVVERARHLMAAAGGGDDPALAGQLDAAVGEAAGRGAVDVALEIAAAAVATTSADAAPLTRLERHLAHAERAFDAGNTPELTAALTAAEHVLACARDAAADAWRDGGERFELLRVAATIYTDDVAEGVARAIAALDVVADPKRRFRLHTIAMRLTQHSSVARGAELAEEYFGAAAEHTGYLRVMGVAELVMARTAVGEPVDLDAAIALADELEPDQRVAYLSRFTEPMVWTDHPRSAEFLEMAIAGFDSEGRRAARIGEVDQFVAHRLVRGEWSAAEAGLDELEEFSHENVRRDSARAQHAVLRAARGEVAAARRLLAAVAPRLADTDADPTETLWVLTRVGVAAHTLGDPDAADRLLAAEALATELGVHAVRGLCFRRDLVEALVAAGRVADATSALERLRADAERNQVPTAFADADAAAGVVAAATGDHDRAAGLFAAAAATQREFGLGYELARTLLAAGAAARRAGNRAEAREHLDTARQLFAGMGAATWITRCDDEAERTLGRRAGTATNDLTPTERQIAELVAAGRTNAEIAATLFVSVRTVESNLTRAYRKLGVRSRTELTRHLSGRA